MVSSSHKVAHPKTRFSGMAGNTRGYGVCATLRRFRNCGNADVRSVSANTRKIQFRGNARRYGVCDTLKHAVSQGVALQFAPLRHLRHPLYKGGQGGAVEQAAEQPPHAGSIKRLTTRPACLARAMSPPALPMRRDGALGPRPPGAWLGVRGYMAVHGRALR